MSSNTLFPASRFIGFEKISKDLEDMTHAKDNYPPHNIISLGENAAKIEIAIAGFTSEQLDVEIKDSILFVSGHKNTEIVEYIYQGISNKAFKKSFRLSEYVQVHEATYHNGILSIYLKFVVPDSARSRKLLIKNEDNNENTKQASKTYFRI